MRTSTEITKRSRGRPRGFITEEVLEKVRGVFMAISAVVIVAGGTVALYRSLRTAGVLEGFPD